MRDEEKKWIKWIALAALVGYAIGVLLKKILVAILPVALELIPACTIPVCIILALLIVLYLYQKDKDNTIN